MTSWRTGYAASGGERIYWECAGEGVPIILCHGAGSNHLSFYQQVAGLASDHTQIIVWDQRGYGNSTLTTKVFGISVAAEDLTSVLQAAGLETARVHLVGQAMGGLVAAKWAISNPGRVLTLALWDGPFAVGNEERDLVWTLTPGDQGVRATQVNRQLGQHRALSTSFQEHNPAGTYLYQTIQELGNAKPSFAEMFVAAQAEPMPIASLIALDIPILIGRGEHDHVVDPAAHEYLASLIPRAATITLRGDGHAHYLETPDVWNSATLNHVRKAN